MTLAPKIKKANDFWDFFGIWKKSVNFREKLMHFQQKSARKLQNFSDFA